MATAAPPPSAAGEAGPRAAAASPSVPAGRVAWPFSSETCAGWLGGSAGARCNGDVGSAHGGGEAAATRVGPGGEVAALRERGGVTGADGGCGLCMRGGAAGDEQQLSPGDHAGGCVEVGESLSWSASLTGDDKGEERGAPQRCDGCASGEGKAETGGTGAEPKAAYGSDAKAPRPGSVYA